jgi:hypothetical protein
VWRSVGGFPEVRRDRIVQASDPSDIFGAAIVCSSLVESCPTRENDRFCAGFLDAGNTRRAAC